MEQFLVTSWVLEIYKSAQESSKGVIIPKFPLELRSVDDSTYKRFYNILFEYEQAKSRELKEVQRLYTIFVANQFPKVEVPNEELLETLPGLTGSRNRIATLTHWTLEFKNFPIAKFVGDKPSKKPAVAKSESNTDRRVFMHAKSHGQLKTAEKFNLSIEEVKSICAAQRSLK